MILLLIGLINISLVTLVNAERNMSQDLGDFIFKYYGNGTNATDIAGGKGSLGGPSPIDVFTSHGD